MGVWGGKGKSGCGGVGFGSFGFGVGGKLIFWYFSFTTLEGKCRYFSVPRIEDYATIPWEHFFRIKWGGLHLSAVYL